MNEIKMLPVEEVFNYSRYNHRQFDESKDSKTAILEFGNHIKEKGQLQPIIVAEVVSTDNDTLNNLLNGSDSRRILIAGERRLRGMRAVGISEIEAKIYEISFMSEFLELQAIENLDRENVNPIEEAIMYERLLNAGKTKLELFQIIQFPKKVVKKEDRMTYLNQRLQLLELDPDLQKCVVQGYLRDNTTKLPQANQLAQYPHSVQREIAKALLAAKKYFSDDDLHDIAQDLMVNVEDYAFPKDQKIGKLKPFNEVAEIVTITTTNWRDEEEQKAVCFDQELVNKYKLAWWRQQFKAILECGEPWILCGSANTGYSYRATPIAAYVLNDELHEILQKGAYNYDEDWKMPEKAIPVTLVHGYKKVEKDSSTNVIKALCVNKEEYGQIFYICPEYTKCSVHYPEKEKELQSRREEKRADAKAKLPSKTFRQHVKSVLETFTKKEVEDVLLRTPWTYGMVHNVLVNLSAAHANIFWQIWTGNNKINVFDCIETWSKSYSKLQKSIPDLSPELAVQIIHFCKLIEWSTEVTVKDDIAEVISYFDLAYPDKKVKTLWEQEKVLMENTQADREQRWSEATAKQVAKEKKALRFARFVMPFMLQVPYDTTVIAKLFQYDEAKFKLFGRELSVSGWRDIIKDKNYEVAARKVISRINELPRKYTQTKEEKRWVAAIDDLAKNGRQPVVSKGTKPVTDLISALYSDENCTGNFFLRLQTAVIKGKTIHFPFMSAEFKKWIDTVKKSIKMRDFFTYDKETKTFTYIAKEE